MADQNKQVARKGAQKYFTQSGYDEKSAREARKKERTMGVAKIAKLRALRLAKEAMDKEEGDKLAAERTAAIISAPCKASSRSKPAKLVRMRY